MRGSHLLRALKSCGIQLGFVGRGGGWGGGGTKIRFQTVEADFRIRVVSKAKSIAQSLFIYFQETKTCLTRTSMLADL